MEIKELFLANVKKYIRPQTDPVAVKLVFDDTPAPEGAIMPMEKYGYPLTLCQGVSAARRMGLTMVFRMEDNACPPQLCAFGYLPQDFGFYPEFTVKGYLYYVAALKGLTRRDTKRKVEELLEQMTLTEVRNKKIVKLSGGMKRRVGIAQALLNEPEVLVLDEPTSGLDPGERVRFRNLLSEFAHDKIVLISTHIVSDVEYIAMRNAIMKDGKITIDTDACNHCGRCTAACPFGAVTESVTGYKVYIGGRWGKKIASGRPLDKIFTSEEEVIRLVERIILFFRDEGVTGERFADTIARLGFDYVQDKLLNSSIDKAAILKKEVEGGATC